MSRELESLIENALAKILFVLFILAIFWCISYIEKTYHSYGAFGAFLASIPMVGIGTGLLYGLGELE